MSNKNIALTKYKWETPEQLKKTNSGVFTDNHKMTIQYSQKNLPKDVKSYKTNVIYRHASEEEFKRFNTPPQQNVDYNLVSAEEEYFSNYGTSKPNNEPKKIGLPSLTQPNSSSRNHLKETSSTSSIEHTANRRVSPSSTLSFFRSKPKLAQKQGQPTPSGLTRDNFKVLRKLGQGKFGKVYLVKQIHTGFVMAMKVLQKKKIIQDNILEQFIRELKIQAFLNHPNIIDVFGFFHDETYFYTLLELGSDGQLYNIIAQHKNLTEEATSFITKNLLEAVHCMHENKILHRDIKPQNIVLIMGNVKLCDFGWAVNKIKKEQLRSTFCGTPLYLSPELLKGFKYDEKVDLWAIGILAYELLIGSSPFEINEQQDLYKILTDEVKFPKNRKISVQFQQFTHSILNKNPKDRLPSGELLRLQFIRKYEQFQTCEELCS